MCTCENLVSLAHTPAALRLSIWDSSEITPALERGSDLLFVGHQLRPIGLPVACPAHKHTCTQAQAGTRGTLYPALQSASTECAAAQKVACHVHCSVGKWRQGQGARKLCSNRIFTRSWKCNFFKVSVHALGAWYTWSLSDTIGSSWYSILARHCFSSGSPAGWPKLKTIGCKVNWQKVSGVQQPFKWLSVMSAENNLKSLPAVF